MTSPICENGPRKNCIYALFLELLHFRERNEVAEFFSSALSHLVIHRCLGFGPGDCSGGPQDTENGIPVVHICWPQIRNPPLGRINGDMKRVDLRLFLAERL